MRIRPYKNSTRKATKMSDMTLPGFICIGAQKAGTTWLFEQLKSHPDIWMPPIKELHYFDARFVPGHRSWTARGIRKSIDTLLNQHEKSGRLDPEYLAYLTRLAKSPLFSEAWYRNAFDRPAARDRLTGEITPAYCLIPEAGIRYVKSFLGPVKIIYLIREPLARALSNLRMKVGRRGLEQPSAAAWRDLADSVDVRERGDYRLYVPRWKAEFAASDILFLPFGRIAAEPHALLRDVEDFLSLSRHSYPDAARRVHSSKKIPVPADIVSLLEGRAAEQRAFLASEFGADFLKRT
jgi:hypothetical protein